MNMWKTTVLGSAMAILSGTTAMAGCGIEGGSVRILSNDFPALHAVAAGAEACAGDGVEVSKNQTADHKDPAFSISLSFFI